MARAINSVDVLIVDDEALFAETLAAYVEDQGLAAASVHCGADAEAYFAGGAKASVLVIDWNMPEMDGPSLLTRLRTARVETPALFLTGLRGPIFEERGLKLGAVDFIEKSRSLAVILHRIQLVLAGVKGAVGGDAPAGDMLRIGALDLDMKSQRATWQGKSLDLTLSEFRITALLATANGRDVAYRGIYDVVRGEGFHAGYGDDGFRANVRALVKRIRKKFRAIDPDFDNIQSYAGFGYRWDATPGNDPEEFEGPDQSAGEGGASALPA